MTLMDRVMGRPSSTTYDAVRADLEPDGRATVIFWRPGCGFCQRLALGVRAVSHRAQWVNIWADDDARAFVRSVNGGDETVPTVVIDGHRLTNPAPRVVREALTS